MRPNVSFIVPCYKFGNFLEECIHSILEQTFSNFEILIMDDCSPDNTPEVAASLADRRIKYVRNEHNLGHLRNYNKGIALALGEYIWLISPDDRLRKPYVLERYMRLMKEHPNVGYVFCPGLILEEGGEKGLVDWAVLDEPDSILDGREFLYRLLRRNHILAPAVLARAECYRTVGPFPLDMPYAGDWYLWCAFALHYDVAYFAEPMVNYRLHNLSMTNTLRTHDIAILSRDELALCWRMREKIRATGHRSLERHCKREIYGRYIAQITGNLINLEEFELSLHSFAKDARERESIEQRVLGRAAFQLYLKQEFRRACDLYNFAVHRKRRRSPVLWADYVLLKLGRNGVPLARAASLFKREVVGVLGGQ
jgi:glycosyltransferase involved in cell wall biosynthesis